MKLLAKANPNRHGWIRLLKDEDDNFFVTTPDDEDGTEFDGNETAARQFYADEVKAYSDKPNWEVQAEYDQFWK